MTYQPQHGILLVFSILSFLHMDSHGLIHPKMIVYKNNNNHNIRYKCGSNRNWNCPTSFHRLDKTTISTTSTTLTMSTFDNNNKPDIQQNSNSSDTTTSNDFFQTNTEGKDISDSTSNKIMIPKMNEFLEKIQTFLDKWQGSKESSSFQLPPLIVEDQPLLLYDIFLLINLSLSISFWVVHRLSFEHIATALSEGSLLCIIWIISGLYHGSFLYSSVDGHYRNSEEGGPKSAGMLALSTFITTANIRIVVALVMALIEHRPVGTTDGELLMPLEITSGILLMSSWRALHSYSTPRI